jgi:uncharacterized protein (DUF488 family)
MSEIRLANPDDPRPAIYTIGHSTRQLADFIQLLKTSEIENLIDVRHFPGSRRYPQFNQKELARALNETGIDYHHLVRLGGRRQVLPDSRNTAWRNASFRAYADHMETVEFKEGIDELLQLTHHSRAAIMCAEAVWWRCPYTTAARIVDGQLSYSGLFPE